MDLLTNAIQPYAWGSRSAIAALQGRATADQPEAELWMGAHPLAPSRVRRAGWATLIETIAADPQTELGPAVVEAFGPRLPFLLKVLAAAKPLSLQVHPTPEQARVGFDAEDARGIPRDAPDRNYRDPYSKPELIVALTPFTGLCGFRSARDLAALLDELAVPSLKEYGDALAKTPDEATLRDLLAGLLRWPQAERAALVAEVAGRCALLRTSESRFAASFDWAARVADDYPDDTGVVVVLLLNLVQLAPGQAVFLKPRTLHAYLEGTGVEIMAGSDNVLRGGLTPKHIDVDELLGLLDFSNGPLPPTPTTDVSADERAWVTPTPEFRLSEVALTTGHPVTLSGGVPQIVLCTAGAAHLDDGTSTLDVARGESVFVPASTPVVRATTASGATLFRAVPGL